MSRMKKERTDGKHWWLRALVDEFLLIASLIERSVVELTWWRVVESTVISAGGGGEWLTTTLLEAVREEAAGSPTSGVTLEWWWAEWMHPLSLFSGTAQHPHHHLPQATPTWRRGDHQQMMAYRHHQHPKYDDDHWDNRDDESDDGIQNDDDDDDDSMGCQTRQWWISGALLKINWNGNKSGMRRMLFKLWSLFMDERANDIELHELLVLKIIK